ncbi:hypothetical protein HanPI659440_Chr02g0042571 [Helianthus annuus]|nr:hypothetical protein HanPI659440_Chr02g0042571 [Helianthus annuus]
MCAQICSTHARVHQVGSLSCAWMYATLVRVCATSPVNIYDHATQSCRIGSLWCARTSHQCPCACARRQAWSCSMHRALAATRRSAKCAIKAPIAHATRAHVRFIGCLAHFASTLVCASCNNKEEVFLLKYPFKFHLSSYVAQCATFSIF